MRTIIDKQVRAFDDAVMESHSQAMESWNVQDIAKSAPMVVRMLRETVELRRTKGGLDGGTCADFHRVAEELLKALVTGMGMIRDCQDAGFVIEGAENYFQAILETRELIAFLSDPHTTAPELPDPGQFSELAKTHGPPQSWFEEDTRNLG